MQYETAVHLYRAADKNVAILQVVGFDIELAENIVETDVRRCLADVNAQCSMFVVGTNSDDRTCETRITHTRQGKQKLAGKVSGAFHNSMHNQIIFLCP